MTNSQNEITKIEKSCQIAASVLRQMIKATKAGMPTKELDDFGHELIKSYNAKSAPIAMYQFPGATCICLNHEVAHGIPSSKKIIQNGDLINIDVSVEYEGYYGDNGCSFVVGEDTNNHSAIINCSKKILNHAIKIIKPGLKISEFGKILEKETVKAGYHPIRNLVGHGIGKKLHQHPLEIPCFYDPENKDTFKEGMTVAIETFISNGSEIAHLSQDDWTLTTKNNGYTAQHEHTLLITKTGCRILTQNNGI